MADHHGGNDEQARLNALLDFDVMDTEAEAAFDRLTRLASTYYQSPIALVSLVDDHRQWFKSRVGLAATETPRDIAFCHHAIKADDPFIVQDALKDPRFASNPLVTEDPDIRFYAGAPLITDEGYRVGTLCVIDTEPRPDFSKDDAEQLRLLSEIVISELNLRKKNRLLAESLAEIRDRDEKRSAFLSTISHEIRTPLGAVVGLADTLGDSLAKTSLPTDDKLVVEGIRSSSRILMGLLDDILDLSKLEVGKIIIQQTDMRLEALTTMIQRVWAPAAKEKGLKFSLEADETLPDHILVDELRLTQVVNNFVSNAIKFTDKGSVTVKLAPLTPGRKTMLEISVKDTGCGMDETEQAAVFQPFEQAHGDVARKHGGTGLGMPISRQLMELMGGTVSFTSVLGKGSIFKAIAPLIISDGSAASDEAAPQTLKTGLAVLVVDDVPMNRRLASHMLTKLVDHVGAAEDGQQAIEMASSRHWDLILMDIRMPDMDGFEASRQILAHNPDQLIVALSADRMSGDVAHAIRIGMAEYMAKPLTMEGLQAVLMRYCAENGGH